MSVADTESPRAINPFPGLRSYSAAEAARFFGREQDLGLVTSRIFSCRTTVLFAGSGVGKTSFLEAKLMPALSGKFVAHVHRAWAGGLPLNLLSSTLEEGYRGQSGALLPFATDDLSRFFTFTPDAFPDRSLLILDQFEELFQHHHDTPALRDFVERISKLISDPKIELRVLFSMREEFLGELSVFDNLVPDLFNNYYRLKNLNENEAFDVIERTAMTVGVSCHEPGLHAMLGDLRKPLAKRRAADEFLKEHVTPPYMQIVCQRIWQETKPSAGDPFLKSYRKGDAQRVLRRYCREKLSPLSDRQKQLASDAFGMLMTKRGAKMAYATADLADLLHVDEPALMEVLEILRHPDVRILRMFADPPWVELYHDMYAPFLIEWKGAFEAARKRRQQKLQEEADRQKQELDKQRRIQEEQRKIQEERRIAIEREKALFEEAQRQARRRDWIWRMVMALIALSVAAYLFGFRARAQRQMLAAAVNELSDPVRSDMVAHQDVAQAHDDLNAFGILYERLSSTKPSALWTRYWQKRVERAAAEDRRDPAILYAFRTLVENGDPSEETRRMAAVLTGGSYRNLAMTYRAGGRVRQAVLTRDGGTLIAALEDGRLQKWNAETGEPSGTVLIPVTETRPPAGQQTTAKNNRSAKAPQTIEAISDDGKFAILSVGAAFRRSSPGSFASVASRDIDLQLLRLDAGRVMPAFALRRPWQEQSRVEFSPDGTAFAVLSKTGLELCAVPPVEDAGTLKCAGQPKFSTVKSFAFSSDGARLVTARLDGNVEVVDPKTGATISRWVVPPMLPPFAGFSPPPGVLTFSPDGKVLVEGPIDNLTIYDANTGKPLSSRMRIPSAYFASAVKFDSNGQLTLVYPKGITFWQLGDGRDHTAPSSVVEWESLDYSDFDDYVVYAAIPRRTESLITADSQGVIRQWRLPPPVAKAETVSFPDPLTAATLSGNGMMAVATRIQATGKTRLSVLGESGKTTLATAFRTPIEGFDITGLQFLGDGKELIVSAANDVEVWSYRDGPLKKIQSWERSRVISGAGRGEIVIGSDDDKCGIYDGFSGEEKQDFEKCSAATWSRGRLAIVLRETQTQMVIRFWDQDPSGEWKAKLPDMALPAGEQVTALTWGPGPNKITTQAAGLMTVWNIRDLRNPTKIGVWRTPRIGNFINFETNAILAFAGSSLNYVDARTDRDIRILSRPAGDILDLYVPNAAGNVDAEVLVRVGPQTILRKRMALDLSDAPPMILARDASWSALLADWEKKLALRLGPDLRANPFWTDAPRAGKP